MLSRLPVSVSLEQWKSPELIKAMSTEDAFWVMAKKNNPRPEFVNLTFLISNRMRQGNYFKSCQ